MKVPKILNILITLVFLSLSFVPNMVLADKNFSMKEGNVERTHTVDASEVGGIMSFQWKLPLGNSISQPIVVDNFIYHLAAIPSDLNIIGQNVPMGTYLWKIPVSLNSKRNASTEDDLWSDWLENGGTAIRLGDYADNRSTPTYAANGVIYIGWGDPTNSKVAAINPDRMDILGYINIGTASNPNRLVSAPHFMGNDLIVFGDQKSSLIAVKGLATSNPNVTKMKLNNDNDSTAEVTGTTTQVSETDIVVGVNFRGKNKPSAIQRISIIDNGEGVAPTLQKAWDYGIQTDNGVPTSIAFSKEQNKLYFSDKTGTIYTVDSNDGRANKITKYKSSVQLINNSPALGSSTVYFPVRNTNDSANNGMIIALNMDGTERFVLKEKTSIGQDPLIVKTKTRPIIFYGTTDGSLHALDTSGEKYQIADDVLETVSSNYAIQLYDEFDFGKLVEFGFGEIPTAYSKHNTDLKVTKNPAVPAQSWLQGGGLATEITFGQNMLLFGANTSNRSGQDSGELWAYRFSPEINNLKLNNELTGDPSSPGKPGIPVVFTATVTNTGDKDVRETSLVWQYEGEPAQTIDLPFGIKAGETVPVQINTTYPERTKNLRAFVNPNLDQPKMEENWSDNYQEWNIGVVRPQPNLKIVQDSLDVTKSFSYNNDITVSFEVLSESVYNFNEPITTNVNLSAVGKNGDFDHNENLAKTVTLQPGESQRVSFTWHNPDRRVINSGCTFLRNGTCERWIQESIYPPTEYDVNVSINASQTNPPDEVTYQDNYSSFYIKGNAVNFKINNMNADIETQAPNRKKPDEQYFIVGKYGVPEFNIKIKAQKDLGYGPEPVTLKLTVDGYGRRWTKSKSLNLGNPIQEVIFTVPNITEQELKNWQNAQGDSLLHDSYTLTAELIYPGKEATKVDNIVEGVIETDELTRSQLTK